MPTSPPETWPLDITIREARHLWSVTRHRMRKRERETIDPDHIEAIEAARARQTELAEKITRFLEEHDPEWKQERARREGQGAEARQT